MFLNSYFSDHRHAWCHIKMCSCAWFCLHCYWDSIRVILSVFYYCNLSTYDQNVTTTAIGLQSTLNRLFGCLFSWYDIITCKVNKSLGVHFQTLFSKIVLFFDVPQSSNRFDYIKDRRRAVYFNNQKHHCISPLTQSSKSVSEQCNSQSCGWIFMKFGQQIDYGLEKSSLWSALWNRADHYIFMLWFVLSSSSSFFSLPNLSHRRLDVCHTSTHGVALVRI